MKNIIEFHNDIRDIMRDGIIERSIEIFRNHGMNDEQIKQEIIKDFQISKEDLDKMMKKNKKNVGSSC